MLKQTFINFNFLNVKSSPNSTQNHAATLHFVTAALQQQRYPGSSSI
jgi:hypothetical protein